LWPKNQCKIEPRVGIGFEIYKAL